MIGAAAKFIDLVCTPPEYCNESDIWLQSALSKLTLCKSSIARREEAIGRLDNYIFANFVTRSRANASVKVSSATKWEIRNFVFLLDRAASMRVDLYMSRDKCIHTSAR